MPRLDGDLTLGVFRIFATTAGGLFRCARSRRSGSAFVGTCSITANAASFRAGLMGPIPNTRKIRKIRRPVAAIVAMVVIQYIVVYISLRMYVSVRSQNNVATYALITTAHGLAHIVPVSMSFVGLRISISGRVLILAVPFPVV